jgi:hypothetical protein
MQRNRGLIRQILRKLEQKANPQGVLHPSQYSGYDENTVSYHMNLPRQAGLIEANCKQHGNAPVFYIATI